MAVILRETWNNGEAEHTWRMVVSPTGAILSHTGAGVWVFWLYNGGMFL